MTIDDLYKQIQGALQSSNDVAIRDLIETLEGWCITRPADLDKLLDKLSIPELEKLLDKIPAGTEDSPLAKKIKDVIARKREQERKRELEHKPSSLTP